MSEAGEASEPPTEAHRAFWEGCGLPPCPTGSRWPRLASPPHPDAVGSYGAEFLHWAADRLAIHPKRITGYRWWQQLAAYRALEHDAAGNLCWPEVVLTTPRQVGKGFLIRALALWRMEQADRWGEVQTVLHGASQAKQAAAIWSPAARWAAAHPHLSVRWGSGEKQILARDGSVWLIQAANDDFGVSLSVSLALVDEAWNVEREVVTAGLAPTMSSSVSPQLWLISTAGVPRVGVPSDLVPSKRAAALRGSLRVLLLEWSARPGSADGDPAVWQSASPWWDPARAEFVAGAWAGVHDPLSLDAFRRQYLNQWVVERPQIEPELPGEPLLPEGAWLDLATSARPAWTAAGVEAAFGRAPVVALAGALGDGRVIVSVRECASMLEAVAVCTGLRRVAVGKSLQGDPAWLAVGAEPRVGTSAALLAQFRTLVDDQVIAHDGGDVLTAQVLAARIGDGPGGPRVLSRGRLDAVKAVVWAVDAARKAPPTPQVW